MNLPHITLIQLYGSMQPPDAEPLSIEVLAGAVAAALPDIKLNLLTIRERSGEDDINQITAEIASAGSGIVGISVPQSTMELALCLIGRINRDAPGSIVVVGHALPTYSPEVFLRTFPSLLIVRGWGEESFVEIVRHCFYGGKPALADIPNLCYLHDDEIVMTLSRWPSTISGPARIDAKRYFSRVESSRGCHHDVCTFCTRPPRLQHQRSSVWQRRSAADVIRDVLELKSLGMTYFTFADEDFIGNDLEGAIRIAESLQTISGIQFSLSIRADNILVSNAPYVENQIRRRLLEVLRDAGLYLVFIGIEALSNSQLKRYGKGVQAHACIQAAREVQRLGIGVEVGYILFDPFLSQPELLENLHHLDESGLWIHVSQLYNHLRPQSSSSYVNLLAAAELLGDYDPNLMSYGFRFSDNLVGDIFRYCNSWYRQFDPIYLLARNIERNSSSSGAYAHFVFGVRSLLFRFLRAVVDCRITRRQAAVDPEIEHLFDSEREGHIRNLYRYIAAKSHSSGITETEAALKRDCEAFLGITAKTHTYVRMARTA